MKEVALDSIHGTNEYNLQLTMLPVTDNHGEKFLEHSAVRLQSGL